MSSLKAAGVDAATVRQRQPRATSSRFLLATGLVANAATASWVALAVHVSDRGLGLANEGFYLLAYQYWDRNPRTFTGAQYLFGPLFGISGGDIPALRLVRLALILAVHVFFAVSFARWLRLRRPSSAPTVASEYCIASVVVVPAVVMYGWLPPTPGYNDLTLLGSMVMVGLLLLDLRMTERDRAPRMWTGLVWGVIAGAMVLAKPPVVVTVALIAAVSALALSRAGGRLARPAVGAALGVGLFALLVPFFALSWGDIVGPMREQLRVVSASTHSPLQTVVWYATSTLTLLRAVALVCAPTAIAAGLAQVFRRRLSSGRRAVVVLAGFAASLALLAGAGGLRAGPDNVLAFASGIAAMVVLATASTTLDRRPVRGWVSSTTAVVVLLALVPALQGFGTNNALYAVAVNGAGLWVALMVFLVTRTRLRLSPRPALGVTATTAAVVLTIVIGVDGLTHDGTGRSLVAGGMAHVAGSRELSTISLPSEEAAQLSRLREDLGIRPGAHRPMLAYGDLAQYILVLGGRPIGEAWYSHDDDGLNAADLRAACRHGNPWGAQQPLVVAIRRPSDNELAAWRTCGVDFAREYADVTPASAPAGIRVLRWQPPAGTPVPRGAPESSTVG